MEKEKKAWWRPVWRGLVVDAEGKHVRQLKSALPLYLYFILHADRHSGVVVRKMATIATDMGMSRWTVRAWMRRLIQKGYITARRTGRATVVKIERYQRLGHGVPNPIGTELPIKWASTVQNVTDSPQKAEQSSGSLYQSGRANKSIHTRVLQQEERGLVRIAPTTRRTPMSEKTSKDLLAQDLTDGLEDPGGLARYRDLAGHYPEELLYRLLSEARAIPQDQIRQSRAAVFRYLLNQHHHGRTENIRN